MWSELTHAPQHQVLTAERPARWHALAPSRYLVAWKTAALILGHPRLFHCQSSEELMAAQDRERICPDYAAFLAFMESAPFGDRVYAASLYSFYNPVVADKWLERLGRFNPGALCVRLSSGQLSALSELMRWHYGW